jgi:hypothetical protein
MNNINNDFTFHEEIFLEDDTDDVSMSDTEELVFDVSIPILNIFIPEKTA